MKNAVQNETESYALSFGENSEFNKMTLRLFKEYGAKSIGENFEGNEPRSFFTMMQDFNQITEDMDKALEWKKVDQSINRGYAKKSTAMVFGECGQGKSTVLNNIVDLIATKYPN